jgi:hypothetical protein
MKHLSVSGTISAGFHIHEPTYASIRHVQNQASGLEHFWAGQIRASVEQEKVADLRRRDLSRPSCFWKYFRGNCGINEDMDQKK